MRERLASIFLFSCHNFFSLKSIFTYLLIYLFTYLLVFVIFARYKNLFKNFKSRHPDEGRDPVTFLPK
ncbi:MAG: hypothetical protein RLZZ379_1378 [Pseudomonadota bacterium]